MKNCLKASYSIPLQYFELDWTLVLVKYRSKVPIPNPKGGGWWRLDDKESLISALKRCPKVNFAWLTDGFVQIDTDSIEAVNWAKDRGLSSDNCWVLHTARGWRSFYRINNTILSNLTDPEHKRPDLLAPGSLAIVPPSVHPLGLRYHWAPGHSPFDIPPDKVSLLPESLLKEWKQLKKPNKPIIPNNPSPKWLDLVYQAICNDLASRGNRFINTRDGGVVTNCPMHDDCHPSLSIHPIRGWKCFAGCGEGRLTKLAAILDIRVEEALK